MKPNVPVYYEILRDMHEREESQHSTISKEKEINYINNLDNNQFLTSYIILILCILLVYIVYKKV